MKKEARHESGFAAIAAIFLVVVLAALGGFMLTFSNSQQLGSAQDILGSRAYWAARAGLEWGLARGQASSACPASPTSLSIEGFAVVVSCSQTSYPENAATVLLLRFTALASRGSAGTTGYIERSVSATLER